MSDLFTTSPHPATPDGRQDFDFFHGAWDVTHHRLRQRLVGDTVWDEFHGVSENRPIIGGLGNIDDNLLDLPTGTYRAGTLRLFDPVAASWSIWWVDGRSMQLDTPVQGRFAQGVGTFFGDDLHQGIPIKVRFTWSEIMPRSLRWDQAFSVDGGDSWETNWIMQFTRRA